MRDNPRMPAPPPLPIDAVLPHLLAALAGGTAVLQAPPGAGKTTRVPLALLPQVEGRIVMLEPRRLAARAAAERMAATLGEPLGATVGYRIRGEARVGRATRIEVVTEGILTRMAQDDPALTGIGAVIFDEFHERSLQADLGLALVLDLRAALRPDLRLLVMSATLDAQPVATLVGAPLVSAEGRAFPVDTVWRDRPLPREARLEAEVAHTTLAALEQTDGGVLVFLPGEAEIRRTLAALAGRLPPDVQAFPLYGALNAEAQRAALAPVTGRKLVLATAIAETSLTIDGVRAVVDAGLSRRLRYDPGSGMARLVTERVTRAEAEQRRGRAGRVAPGTCWRMWTRGEDGALAAFPPAEIEVADLAGLALDLALWGGDQGLRFLTPPPVPALAEARALLAGLGALDEAGRITAHGRRLAAMPVHPRLAHMLAVAGKAAAPLAALLEDRDPLRGAGADLGLRLRLLADPGRFGRDETQGFDRGAVERMRAEAARLARLAGDGPAMTPGETAALAYPDRIALRRSGGDGRYLLSNGKGALVDPADALARAPMIVATDLDGDPREARVRLGAALPEASLRRLFPDRILWHDSVTWSRRDGRVVARRQERFGALVLDDRAWPDAPPDALAHAAFDGLRDLGLPWKPASRRLRARIALCRGEGLPDASDDALLADPAWLESWLSTARTAADLKALDLVEPLLALVGHAGRATLDRLAPADFVTPLGRKVAIDYEGESPRIDVRLQELFGLTRHPCVGTARHPLRLTLLSPAGRPIQVTTDLPGFWASSYADVRKEMRGRYPRHPWPEDPTQAEPTLRAKPRGT
jgi:ATP-dependent helicase HrpB